MSSSGRMVNRNDNMFVWVGALVQWGGRFLFLRRGTDSKNWGGKWQLPGGLMEWGESPVKTMRREVKEETGLSVTNPTYAGAYTSMLMAGDGTKYHTFLLVYNVRANSTRVRLSHEHDDYRWMSLGEAKRVDLFKDLGRFLIEFSKKI